MKHVILVLALVALLVVGASAATVSYGPASIDLSKTNWVSHVSLQKFDPSLGTLNSVQFFLDGYVEGTAKYESQDADASTVTMNLSAILKLQRPDLSWLVVTTPVVSVSDSATAWDGEDDYDGDSGTTYTNLYAKASNSSTSTSASDLALFSGPGFITLPVRATGASSGSGAGNLWLQFTTKASASVSVMYDYTAVPEPGTCVAAALLLTPAGLILRRKR